MSTFRKAGQNDKWKVHSYVLGVFMCKARVALLCPNCKRKLAVTRPDSLHPLWSLGKPRFDDVEGEVVTQVYTCKNPECNTKVTVYWYGAKIDQG